MLKLTHISKTFNPGTVNAKKAIEDLSFHAPDRSGHKVTVDAAFVETNLGALARSADISRYVL